MESPLKLPKIIQGGMGAGVSNWRLAKAVSQRGQLGVVSGTAIDTIIARRLQIGDPGGDVRRALSNYPQQDTARDIVERYFIPGGKPPSSSFKLMPQPSLPMARQSAELLIAANFVEVYLAKEGHDGLVGINFLEKIQIPTLPSLLGAMLAGVDFVLMGAGIPLSIPGVLDGLSRWEAVEIKINLEDNPEKVAITHRFDPGEYCGKDRQRLARPHFLAVVSSDIVAKTMVRRANGCVDGFVVEYHTAGGHNAPPRKARGKEGEGGPEFGPRDLPNLDRIKGLEKPFWLAGSYASPDRLQEAMALGAIGVQLGTVFAFSEESGILPEIKMKALQRSLAGELKITTDFQISPTGYPFKLVHVPGTVTDPAKQAERERICDLGYLRQPYCKCDDGSKIGYRCPGEPIKNYLKKGGKEDATIGKGCLCNGLLATIGLGQTRMNGTETPIVTAGEDFSAVVEMAKKSGLHYSANDVLDYLVEAGPNAEN